MTVMQSQHTRKSSALLLLHIAAQLFLHERYYRREVLSFLSNCRCWLCLFWGDDGANSLAQLLGSVSLLVFFYSAMKYISSSGIMSNGLSDNGNLINNYLLNSYSTTSIKMSVHNITVPYVNVKDFDWGFNRTGPLPWNQTVW